MEESSVPRSTAIITLKPELLVGGRDTYVGSVSVRGHHVDDCPFPSFRIFSGLRHAGRRKPGLSNLQNPVFVGF